MVCTWNLLVQLGGWNLDDSLTKKCLRGLDDGLDDCLERSKGCNSKNVTESLHLWPHLGDGVSWTRPETPIVRVIYFLGRFDSRAEFRRLRHQDVARDGETQWHFCCYTLCILCLISWLWDGHWDSVPDGVITVKRRQEMMLQRVTRLS